MFRFRGLSHQTTEVPTDGRGCCAACFLGQEAVCQGHPPDMLLQNTVLFAQVIGGKGHRILD